MTTYKGVYFLPNLLTTGALFCGFYAILAAMNSRFEVAAIAVFVAMILDGLDGRVARMVNAQSAFGAEYDSLSDLVSFGLAPALIIYLWALIHMKEVSIAWGKLGWMVAFIYVACAAIRLARFNTQDIDEKKYFIGLPSPTAAAVMVGMVWVFNDLNIDGKSTQILGLVITLGTALLMVSNIKFRSFKDFNIKNKVPHTAVVIMALIFALTAIDPPKVLFITALLYTLSGPLGWLLNRKKNTDNKHPSE